MVRSLGEETILNELMERSKRMTQTCQIHVGYAGTENL